MGEPAGELQRQAPEAKPQTVLPAGGPWVGGGDAAQLVGDRLMDAVEIYQRLVVPKPQNAIPSLCRNPLRLASRGNEQSCWPPSISTINRASYSNDA
jgi:hypothetical protein